MIGPILLAAALAAPPACGLPALAPGAFPWRTGETLTYDLDLVGAVKAGTLQTSVGPAMSGAAIVPLKARAKSAGNVSSVRRVAAAALSWVDARTLAPERYRDEAEEDGLHKVSDTRLRPAGSEIAIETRNGEQAGTSRFAREHDVLDPVSALYRLRAAALAPGERFCLDLVAMGRLWRVEGSVAAKTEKVDTPAGTFQTLRIDAIARRADEPGRTRAVHLWYSTDARHLPVAAVSEIDLGPVQLTLSSVRLGTGE
jgi:hypothetical protein